MADKDLWIRPNRLHCRLYDRLAASPRYRDKNFLARSWNREADRAPQKLLGGVDLTVDDPRMFPTRIRARILWKTKPRDHLDAHGREDERTEVV